jgi:hypothetical protein
LIKLKKCKITLEVDLFEDGEEVFDLVEIRFGQAQLNPTKI